MESSCAFLPNAMFSDIVLKGTTVGVLTSWKLARATNKAFFFLLEIQLWNMLPIHRWVSVNMEIHATVWWQHVYTEYGHFTELGEVKYITQKPTAQSCCNSVQAWNYNTLLTGSPVFGVSVVHTQRGNLPPPWTHTSCYPPLNANFWMAPKCLILSYPMYSVFSLIALPAQMYNCSQGRAFPMW